MHLRICCEGLVFRNLWLPPFELKDQQLLNLRFPKLQKATAETYPDFLDLLAGVIPHPALHIHGKIAVADPYRGKDKLLTYMEWTVDKYFSKLGIKVPQFPYPYLHNKIITLAGTEKLHLVLEGAFTRSDIVIFAQEAIDSMGVEATLNFAAAQLPHGKSFLRILYPYQQQGRIQWSDAAGFQNVDIKEVLD